ncbi:hypothetical protein GCM10023339_76300 [Alloalcanivorax gelatiniphagus]
MHTAYLSFAHGVWTATIDSHIVVSEPVLMHIPRRVLDHVDETWGPYDEVYYHVVFLVEPGVTPLDIDRPMTFVTSVFDPIGDATYETVVLTDTGATTTEVHHVIYGGREPAAARVRLSLNDIVDLVPALSVAGSHLSMRRSSDALSEDGSLTPDKLAGLFEAWPPRRWKQIGMGA